MGLYRVDQKECPTLWKCRLVGAAGDALGVANGGVTGDQACLAGLTSGSACLAGLTGDLASPSPAF